MNKFLGVFLVIIGIPLSSVAGEPITGISQPIGDTGWSWTLSNTPRQHLQLSVTDDNPVVYDISECIFCSGEDDNCEENGIYQVNLQDNEPAIAVVCHKGAHSQRLQLLAPLRDRQKPAFTVTGDYWVNYQPLPIGFKVSYDRRGDDGVPIMHTVFWPEQVTDE